MCLREGVHPTGQYCVLMLVPRRHTHWEAFGDTFFGKQSVLLTDDKPHQLGGLWAKTPLDIGTTHLSDGMYVWRCEGEAVVTLRAWCGAQTTMGSWLSWRFACTVTCCSGLTALRCGSRTNRSLA